MERILQGNTYEEYLITETKRYRFNLQSCLNLQPKTSLHSKTISLFRKTEDENPYLLIAYIYHLYMGLFSGGQVLRAKVRCF